MVLILLFSLLIEITISELPNLESIDEVPLSKSLGFSGKRLGRTLDDAHLGKEFNDLYQEMMKASHEVEKHDVHDLTRLKGLADRRRSIMASPAGKRRARSQAIRREKLNSQSLRSHFEHSRQNNNLDSV
ncbi:unnamed protein product [Pieris macdunnoughi]|uniref:Uncharacterized protein n=1 Tax=Pieris macdunnoughi TaxID=345717 RepID=A0A821U4Z6_9NEOP|nr:unnamed protein product [Pieris macdunnoughi]